MAPSMSVRLKSLIISIILTVTCQVSGVRCLAQSADNIRVAIIQDAESLSLKVSGLYEIADSDNRVLYQGKNLKTTVATYKDGILLGEKNFNTNRLFVKADDADAIIIDGRRFRGNIELIKKDNHLLVVNHIALEDYIKGVLYHEASHYWPQEALKAQAISCRTYAVYETQENKSKDYDVTSDIYSQVYGGRSSERYRTNKAVQQTKDLVLTYEGKIFPAYYHATCGGQTTDASSLWNIDVAALRGIVCGFCNDSPHFRWHAVLSLDEVKDKIASPDYKIKNIKDIVILARDKSGRIINLKIITDEKEKEILAKDFRNLLGPNIIRSTNFNISIVNHDVVFEGLGWGHGVGMCQWGAYFMAKQGYKFDEILRYYYPGSVLAYSE